MQNLTWELFSHIFERELQILIKLTRKDGPDRPDRLAVLEAREATRVVQRLHEHLQILSFRLRPNQQPLVN